MVPSSVAEKVTSGSGLASTGASEDMIAFLAGLPLVSRPVISTWFCQNPPTEMKADASPVTSADRDVELGLRAAIKARFPDDMIAGEEFGETPDTTASSTGTDTGYRWIIDPIDGTKAFVSGKPSFGTLVGLLHNDVPVAGLVDMPVLGETYIGLNGFGGVNHAQMNGTLIAPSQITSLDKARLATTAPDALSPARLADFNRLSAKVAVTNYGGDCHNYALLAAGHIDLVMEDSLAAHDVMAVAALMLAAGAIVTDLDGAPIRLCQSQAVRSDSILAAASESLHKAALAVINSTR